MKKPYSADKKYASDVKFTGTGGARPLDEEEKSDEEQQELRPPSDDNGPFELAPDRSNSLH